MINALEVLSEMDQWWNTRPPGLARSSKDAIHVGITFLYNRTYGKYSALQQDSSRLAHFRQLFTVWKAVALRIPTYPFHDASLDVVREFPLYIERCMPEQYVKLVDNNIFLGVKFTPQDLQRVEQLRRDFGPKGQGVRSLPRQQGFNHYWK